MNLKRMALTGGLALAGAVLLAPQPANAQVRGDGERYMVRDRGRVVVILRDDGRLHDTIRHKIRHEHRLAWRKAGRWHGRRSGRISAERWSRAFDRREAQRGRMLDRLERRREQRLERMERRRDQRLERLQRRWSLRFD